MQRVISVCHRSPQPVWVVDGAEPSGLAAAVSFRPRFPAAAGVFCLTQLPGLTYYGVWLEKAFRAGRCVYWQRAEDVRERSSRGLLLNNRSASAASASAGEARVGHGPGTV